MVEALWVWKMRAPRWRSSADSFDCLGSEPLTLNWRSARIPARADMPMPPTPMKWTGRSGLRDAGLDNDARQPKQDVNSNNCVRLEIGTLISQKIRSESV